MTADDVRTEAIERIARMLWTEDGPGAIGFKPRWEEAEEGKREAYRWMASRSVDALGDLLPTGVEWAVRYETRRSTPSMEGERFDTSTLPVRSEGDARALIANRVPSDGENRRVVSRYAHEWTEVQS